MLNRNPISSKNCKRIFKYSPIRKSILILLPIQKKPLIILPHQSKTLPDLLSYLRVVNEPMASDHRPILVELRTAEKADKIFRTKPYLQNPVGNGITVMWETTVPSYCWVEYGTDTTRLERARMIVDGQVVCNNKLHKIRIDGLQPGQKYYYRVCSQEMLLYQAYKRYLEIQHNRPSVNLLFLLLIQSLLPLLFLMICINIPILSVLYVNKYRMLNMILLFSMVTVWMILWITSRQPHLSVN